MSDLDSNLCIVVGFCFWAYFCKCKVFCALVHLSPAQILNWFKKDTHFENFGKWSLFSCAGCARSSVLRVPHSTQ